MQEQKPLNPWQSLMSSKDYQEWIPSRDKVKEIREQHPEWTLNEIGEELGISRERVRQILRSENLETRSAKRVPKPMPPCVRCGEPVPYRKRIYCSPNCQRPNGRTTLHCHYCNKPVEVMSSIAKSRNSRYKFFHCSRECRNNSRRGKSIIGYNDAH